MSLITIEHLTKSYTERLLFDDTAFSINEGEKVGLIGINGTGKSTLLKIVAGLEEPDDGSVVRRRNLYVRYLPQIPVFTAGDTVLDAIVRDNQDEPHFSSREEIDSLEKEVASLQAKIAASASSDIAENAREVNGVKVVAVSVDGADANALREMADKLRDKLHSAVVVLATKDGAKLQLCAGVTPDLVKKGLKAGELVKFVAAQVGGKGGGKPDFAMAGGSYCSSI